MSSINKPDCNNAVDSFAYTEITLFIETMRNILKDETFGVGKCILGVIKRNTMFFNVDMVFGFAPLKCHKLFIMHICIIVNTIILITKGGDKCSNIQYS